MCLAPVALNLPIYRGGATCVICLNCGLNGYRRLHGLAARMHPQNALPIAKWRIFRILPVAHVK